MEGILKCLRINRRLRKLIRFPKKEVIIILKVVKYYSVFDIAYKSKEEAIAALEGWEHKERLYCLIKEMEPVFRFYLEQNFLGSKVACA